jgi:hypothetical protein
MLPYHQLNSGDNEGGYWIQHKYLVEEDQKEEGRKNYFQQWYYSESILFILQLS